MKKRGAATTWAMLAPPLLLFGLFWAFPIVYSFAISFFKFELLRIDQAHWVGAGNYLNLLKDEDFRTAFGNTLIFVFGTIPFTTAIALGLAVAINAKLPAQGLFRAGFFMPTVVSMVVISIIFMYFYSPDGGLNQLLGALGAGRRGWLTDPGTALPSIMAMDIWASVGYYMVLFLAALQAIPAELYESARIDGARPMHEFRHITLPYLRPMFLFIISINTIRSFQIFVEIFAMTQGKPLNKTLTVVYYLYQTGFSQDVGRFDLGRASAVAYILFAVIMAFSLIYFRALKFGRTVED